MSKCNTLHCIALLHAVFIKTENVCENVEMGMRMQSRTHEDRCSYGNKWAKLKERLRDDGNVLRQLLEAIDRKIYWGPETSKRVFERAYPVLSIRPSNFL